MQAVTDGGGPLIGLDAAPGALVWLTPDDADGLQEALDAEPSVRWVQLPFAGVERFAAAGVLQPDRTWTCVKGAHSEPVAEHALALAPHCAGHAAGARAQHRVGRAEGRVRRFGAGEPQLGLVDLDAGY